MPGKWDGKSRVSNDVYRKNFDSIFKTNPMAKDVRTPKYKPRVVKPKKGKGSFKRIKSKNVKIYPIKIGKHILMPKMKF